MKCERIQELILTDHADGELDEKARRQVDEHIRACAPCAEFKRIADERLSAAVSCMAGEAAPAYLWGRIREKVSVPTREEKTLAGALARIVTRIGASFMRIPKPALAFAAAAMIFMVVMVGRPGHERHSVDAYLAEQMSFLVNLDADESNGASIFDTEIHSGVDSLL